VRNFADIEELVGAASEVERVLGELGETPFEPLKEEQEEGVAEASMEHQVATLNNTIINFFKGGVPNFTPSSSTQFKECQICMGRDHIATSCPRRNEPRPKCAKCGMPHKTENCGVKCSFCSGLGHSEDKCWKKPKDGRSNSGAANFLEVLLNDEAATAQQLNRLCENERMCFHTLAYPNKGYLLNYHQHVSDHRPRSPKMAPSRIRRIPSGQRYFLISSRGRSP